MRARRVYAGERRFGFVCGLFHDAVRRLHVGAVAALGADDQRVLADRREQHELMRHAAAHHAGVGLDRDNLGHARAGENALIGAVAAIVVGFEVGLRGVEGVGVLHRKLAHADHTRARARLVAELGLDLINHKGVLRVARRIVADKLHGCLLMRHAEHHRGVVSVLEAEQLGLDARISAGFLPKRGGHRHGEENLLPVDFVHLLAQDLLDLGGDAVERRELRENAAAHKLHVAAAQHQRMAVDDGAGGLFLKAVADKLTEFHSVASDVYQKFK